MQVPSRPSALSPWQRTFISRLSKRDPTIRMYNVLWDLFPQHFRSVAFTGVYKWPSVTSPSIGCFEMCVTPLCRTRWRKVRASYHSPYLERFNINDHPRGLDVLWFGDFTVTTFRSVTFAGVGATICVTTAIIYLYLSLLRYSTPYLGMVVYVYLHVCLLPWCTYLLPPPTLRTLHVLNYVSFLRHIHKPAEGRCFLLRNHFLVYLYIYLLT